MQIALASLPSSSAITVVKATVEEKTISIAYLSRRKVNEGMLRAGNPQCRLNMDFTPQKMSVRLEIGGGLRSTCSAMSTMWMSPV